MARSNKLGTPHGTGGTGTGYDSDSFARAAENAARFFGTARYLTIQTLFVIAWITLNAVLGPKAYDHYPFILLNLMFSTQAAYAAPLILLAQNRQSERDKAEVERDRDTNARGLAETEFLAREIAELRIMLAQKADREDMVEPLERLTRAVEALPGAGGLLDDDERDD